MGNKTFTLCVVVVAMTGCAAPTNEFECLFQPGRIVELSVCSDARRGLADQIQVVSDAAALPASCEKIGPVAGIAEASGSQGAPAAQRAARDRVVDLGGDTLLVSNVTQGASGGKSSVTLRGVALRCRPPAEPE